MSLKEIITPSQYEELLRNGLPENCEEDHYPVVWLSLPYTNFIWVLTQITPDETKAYGLYQMGGSSQCDFLDMHTFSIRNRNCEKIYCHELFFAGDTLSVYEYAAELNNFITDSDKYLSLAALART